jgi:uncharacterized protein YhhL (DUF1145 family)
VIPVVSYDAIKLPHKQKQCGGGARFGDDALPGGRKQMSDLNQRIEAMYQSDKRGAYILVALLWIVILFVLVMSWPYLPNIGVRITVLIGAAAVLLFNTASIAAMVSHYAEDKEFIYGLDIQHLDAAKQQKD